MARRKRAKKVEYSFDYKGQGWPLLLLRSTSIVASVDLKVSLSSPIPLDGATVIVHGFDKLLKLEPHERNPLPDVEVYERLPGGIVDPILKVEAPGTPREKRTDYDRRRN